MGAPRPPAKFMPMQIEWRAGVSGSCFHAVGLLAAGKQPVIEGVAEALAGPTAAISAFLHRYAIPSEPIWRRLAATSISIESNRDLARAVLQARVAREHLEHRVALLAGLITDAELAYLRAFPNLLDELELRSRPLREQWDAYGPGLLHSIGRRTDRGLVVDSARVALVQPFAGGGGAAFPEINTVAFEAVLANPSPRLPEVVRLAWLLSTLGADLPDFTGLLGADRAREVVAAAMLPAVLAAASQDVEIVAPADDLSAYALQTWQVELPRADAAVVIDRWFEFSRTRQTPWNVALKGLEGLLFDETEPTAD